MVEQGHHFGGFYYPKCNIGHASSKHANGSGGSIRQINDAAFTKRAPIIDSDDDRPLVCLIGYFNQRIKWEITVCSREDVLLHALTTTSSTSVKLIGVIGRFTLLLYQALFGCLYRVGTARKQQ